MTEHPKPVRQGEVRWRKSSYSGGSDMCVEVAVDGGGAIMVRDSKYRRDPARPLAAEPILSFTEGEWAAFVAGVKAGEFDQGALIPRP